MLWITIKRVEKKPPIESAKLPLDQQSVSSCLPTQHFILVDVLSLQNSEYSSRDTCHGATRTNLDLKISTFILFFFSIVNFERNELNDMNTQRRANGTARINKSAPDYWIEGRGMNLLRESEKLFICKTNILLMQDRFGFSWRMKSIFYLTMVSLTSQACSK